MHGIYTLLSPCYDNPTFLVSYMNTTNIKDLPRHLILVIAVEMKFFCLKPIFFDDKLKNKTIYK